jgi:hypothetical protein
LRQITAKLVCVGVIKAHEVIESSKALAFVFGYSYPCAAHMFRWQLLYNRLTIFIFASVIVLRIIKLLFYKL